MDSSFTALRLLYKLCQWWKGEGGKKPDEQRNNAEDLFCMLRSRGDEIFLEATVGARGAKLLEGSCGLHHALLVYKHSS